ncbi:hypothetical protein [Chryseobacterium sp.]|uniref:hypothetical protein n=1 Tax=Chryseobacterium sp. TaxID=1871047 RepID=UPI0025C63B70|nr:hypothetical protein [Chryseobacterium sp.]MBV8325947.1 hypothetical protein [Chryseobacterium sp.]
MKTLFSFMLFTVMQLSVYSQETIDFEFSFPENSHFTIEQHTDNSGTMKITGSAHDIEALKKAAYNQNRKLRYLMNYTSEYTTGKKTTGAFPFDFSYSSISFDIDSDGKKQKKEGSFSSSILKGDVVKGKLSVVAPANTGSSSQDQYINSLPKYFSLDFPTVKNMKTGAFFTVKRATDNKAEGYSFSGNVKYILTKIENELAYFSIEVIFKNDPNSVLKSSGYGSGEMITIIKKNLSNLKR